MQQAGSTKKFHTMIQFNQKVWLKSYTDMNTKLRTEAKKWFWKRHFEANK